MYRFILKDKKPIPEPDPLKWANWFEDFDQCIVKKDKVRNVNVSTVFLGLNHSLNEKKPILFETMIFGGKHNCYQERYATWEQAEAGHERALIMVKEEK